MLRSPKLNFLSGGGSDEGDAFETLVKVERSEYKPNPTGTRVHRSLSRTRIMRGGLGSGKTRCATEHINSLALRYPGSLHFIGRKDITALKVTTQKEFLEKVVAPETIQTFNVNENNLYYKNGSCVIFRETKEPDKVKSLELTSYMLDEADENQTDEIWEKLDDRLRQKVLVGGVRIVPPYAGLLVFNPTDEEHWLYFLAQRTDIDLTDFRFDTEENRDNLPPDYLPNLRRKLAPWDIERLVHGHWGRSIKGKAVIHGFTEEGNVRALRLREDLPLLRGWDFGFNHPACSFAQIDPKSGRYMKLKEILGSKMYLPEFVKLVKEATKSIVGTSYPTFDYGDPHGADKKDTGPGSIEYLRVHHNIYVNHRRQRIVVGLEELQERVLQRSPIREPSPDEPEPPQASHVLVDPSCRVTIAAYLGGYHRDEHGEPVKDGYYDHLVDTDRYILVHNMNAGLVQKFKTKRRYIPRNATTGY